MIKNIYVKSSLVLASICVGSALLIGGLNTVAEIYKANHKSTEAPADIKALKVGATFEEVADYSPISSKENSTRVTLNSVYALKEGGITTGFAYLVNCSKPVNTAVEFTVLFEGKINAGDVDSVKPTAINIITAGDAGYDGNVNKLADSIVSGSATYNDYSSVVSGGTKSQRFFVDGVNAARKDYVERIATVEEPKLEAKLYALASSCTYTMNQEGIYGTETK